MSNKLEIIKEININADSEKIFSVLTKVEKCNLWTESISKITLINGKELKANSEAKILQPKLPEAIWKVTDFSLNKSFTWESKSALFTIVAHHIIHQTNNTCRVELITNYKGFFAPVVFYLSKKLTDKYMTMEINGLKKECEKK